MSEEMTKEEQIAELRENIRQGEEFLKLGYDCEWLMAMSRALLAELEGEE